MSAVPAQSATLAVSGLPAPPAVAAGTATPADHAAAKIYCGRVKRRRLQTPVAAEVEDVARAKVYEHEVLSDLSGGIAGAVAAAVGPAVAAAVGPAIAAALAPMNSFVAKAENHKAFEAVAHGTVVETAALVPLTKTIPGSGAGLPGGPLPSARPLNVAVGEAVPSPPFPGTVLQSRALTNQRLVDLSVMLNSTFGVVAGDTLAQRRAKFVKHITGNF